MVTRLGSGSGSKPEHSTVHCSEGFRPGRFAHSAYGSSSSGSASSLSSASTLRGHKAGRRPLVGLRRRRLWRQLAERPSVSEAAARQGWGAGSSSGGAGPAAGVQGGAKRSHQREARARQRHKPVERSGTGARGRRRRRLLTSSSPGRVRPGLFLLVEPRGLEPLTFCLPDRCSTS